MTKISKKRKIALTKIDNTKTYSLKEASSVVKEATDFNFDASVDLAIRLGVDPKKS
jgi:large subunit ribosomal protein L1